MAAVPENDQSLLLRTLAIFQYVEREVDCDFVLKCDDDTLVLIDRVLTVRSSLSYRVQN